VAMSITTPRSCSISRIVTPTPRYVEDEPGHVFLLLEVHPGIGSSRRRSFGLSASARPSSTRLRRP